MNLQKPELNEKSNVVESPYSAQSATPIVAECALAEAVTHERRASTFNVVVPHPGEPLHRKGEWRTPRCSTSNAVDRHRSAGMRSSSYMVPAWLYAAR